MADLNLSVSEIKELMTHLSKTNLKKLEVNDTIGFHIIIEAQDNNVVQTVIPVQQSTPIVQQTVTLTEESKASEKVFDGNVVKSPIVGTYYSAPAPDKAPFVTVGSKVKKGDTLFIIESMKLMNEVQSDFDGEVTEIFIQEGTGVEFNQPIMTIK